MSRRRGGVLVPLVHYGRGESAHSPVGGSAEEVGDDAEVGRQRVGTSDTAQEVAGIGGCGSDNKECKRDEIKMVYRR